MAYDGALANDPNRATIAHRMTEAPTQFAHSEKRGVATPAGIMTLTCKKCTRFGTFGGASMEESVAKAKKKGWSMSPDGLIVVCGRCPK